MMNSSLAAADDTQDAVQRDSANMDGANRLYVGQLIMLIFSEALAL